MLSQAVHNLALNPAKFIFAALVDLVCSAMRMPAGLTSLGRNPLDHSGWAPSET